MEDLEEDQELDQEMFNQEDLEILHQLVLLKVIREEPIYFQDLFQQEEVEELQLQEEVQHLHLERVLEEQALLTQFLIHQ